MNAICEQKISMVQFFYRNEETKGAMVILEFLPSLGWLQIIHSGNNTSAWCCQLPNPWFEPSFQFLQPPTQKYKGNGLKETNP